MTKKILYLFTRTPLHVGAGSSVGAIDQPIVRERHTGFPVIPGSAIKGVLADGYLADESGKRQRTSAGKSIFGEDDTRKENAQSGSVSFGEAKLLAFPIRSLKGCFAWLVSPLTLLRWARETGAKIGELPASIGADEAYGDAATLGINGQAVFEDYPLTVKAPFPTTALEALVGACDDELWKHHVRARLVLVNDDMLGHFARTACEVAQHVRIDDATGTAAGGALFNQENVPAETLFYAPLTELRDGALMQLVVPPVLQIGGDGTTGLGFCTTEVRHG